MVSAPLTDTLYAFSSTIGDRRPKFVRKVYSVPKSRKFDFFLSRVVQGKPTNCVTKAADVPGNFVCFVRHNANTLNILVHLKLLCAQRGKELGFSLGWT